MQKKAEAAIPTEFGSFKVIVYECENEHNVALVSGDIKNNGLVRVHSQCLTGDTFHSLRCDCNKQLEAAMKKIAKEGGIILYMQQEGRGIGLLNKIKAYALQEQGMDTVQANEKLGFTADQRDYSLAADMLKDLGIKDITLLTNNPHKVKGLEEAGIKVTKRISLQIASNEHSEAYLKTKKEKLGHLID
jgi:3,4-dihydroxy 2-butanone 4-phosphate synthase / GTP cyclohydrolase II